MKIVKDHRWWLGDDTWSDWETYLADWHSRRQGDTIPMSRLLDDPRNRTVTPGEALFQDGPAHFKTQQLDGSYKLVCTGGMIEDEQRRARAKEYR